LLFEDDTELKHVKDNNLNVALTSSMYVSVHLFYHEFCSC